MWSSMRNALTLAAVPNISSHGVSGCAERCIALCSSACEVMQCMRIVTTSMYRSYGVSWMARMEGPMPGPRCTTLWCSNF